jgi:hypothetical protein
MKTPRAEALLTKVCASDESAELLDVLDQDEVAAATGAASWNLPELKLAFASWTERRSALKGDRFQDTEPLP